MYSIIKDFFYLLVFVAILNSCNNDNKYRGFTFSQNNLYIFLRETNSKMGNFSKSYNINDTNYSHVGISTFIDGKIYIIHILPGGLKKQKLKEFFENKKDPIISGQIMLVNKLPLNDFNKISQKINELESSKIKYDFSFKGIDDEKYYCSELVCDLLSNSKSISFKKSKKKLYNFDALYLKRDSIEYYPTDIFINNKLFDTVIKW